MKNKRLLSSFSFIDEKYVKEATPKMTVARTSSLANIVAIAACFLLIISLSLYMFIPFNTSGPDVSEYSDSEYYPLIATIANYRYRPSSYKNNFQRLINSLKKFDLGPTKDAAAENAAPGDAMGSDKGNGYVEVTDNQVDGVIEADLIKRTETHLFRLGYNNKGSKLTVYTIDKENSEKVAEFTLPDFEGSIGNYSEMYLSTDGKTITVIHKYYDKSYNSKVGIISVDVSDVNDIKTKKQITIDGSYSSSRMVDGKLLLISEYAVTARNIDYANPESYVPTITENGVKECIKFKDIIYPEKLTNLRYSVVALMNENDLELLGANALLSFNGAIYVSGENVYVTRGYTKAEKIIDRENSQFNVQMTDIVVLKYSDGTLENKGTLSVEGSIKDQYSMDEYEGHLRVVTSTSKVAVEIQSGNSDLADSTSSMSISDIRSSASLTVFNLESFEKIAEVKDFAPEGEEAASVRFDGDTAYVCTAVVVTFTDPVFFFDLSDYSNITYTDTGVIEGYSTSLIQLGDGILLGIGVEDRNLNKVEVYEELNGEVVSIDKYLFEGFYSTNYKSYLVNRDNDMFGFAIESLVYEDLERCYDTYVLLVFNGYELVEVIKVKFDFYYAENVRAFIDDGYLYITDNDDLKVVSIVNE